jgi:maltose O-acetyltransferase
MGEKAFLGMGAMLVAGKAKTIGEQAIIGAGSVVVRDVCAGETVVGNPACPIPPK